MRMKLYSAPTREEAVALAKADMGQDAIILAEWQADGAYELETEKSL